MLFTPHSMAGAAIGESVGNPFLAFLLGFISHFVLDSIPHYDTTDDGKFTLRQMVVISIDVLIGLYLLYYFFHFAQHKAGFFFGALGGVTPDILDLSPFWNKQFRKTWFGAKMHNFHDRIQKIMPGPVIGLIPQILVIVLASFVLK